MPKIPGLNLPLTSSCVDMVTGAAVTDDELKRRVAGIAGLFLVHGAGPGTIMGAALPRGIDAVAA